MTPAQKLYRARISLPGRTPGKKLTQDQLDELLEVNTGRTSSYELNRVKGGIARDYEEAWRKKLGHRIPWSYIMDPRDDWPKRTELDFDDVESDDPENTLDLPFYGDVPAGDWDEVDMEAPDIKRYPTERDIYSPRRFWRRITGISMFPYLRKGDMVLFHPTKKPTDGVIVLAQKEGLRTVKVAKYTRGGWILKALNEDFEMPIGEWEMVANLVVVKRIAASGLEERYHARTGISEGMLPEIVQQN